MRGFFLPFLYTIKIKRKGEWYQDKSKDARTDAMKEFKYTIRDEVGIHARPAGLLVKEAKKYSSKIMISANGKSSEATKLMAIMAMGIKQGQEVTVTIEGEDENAAELELKEFFMSNL